jgi:SAM-dependent methyltransferase
VVIYSGLSDCWHDDYDLGRPGWPAQVASVAGLPSTATVLELGAGTGKLTRLLVSAFGQVAAIEPDAGMRRMLRDRCPQVRVITGRAEAIPAADESVDGVFIGEAFHMFASTQAAGEIARVLRPGGVLTLMWNLPAGPIDPPIAAVEQLLRDRGPDPGTAGYDPADLNPRRYASGDWRLPFAHSQFSGFREATLPHLQVLDRDGLVAFLASMGWIADLPDTTRLPLLHQIRSLLPAAEYRRPWQARIHWTRLEADIRSQARGRS